jgi:hypothetical protein
LPFKPGVVVVEVVPDELLDEADELEEVLPEEPLALLADPPELLAPCPEELPLLAFAEVWLLLPEDEEADAVALPVLDDEELEAAAEVPAVVGAVEPAPGAAQMPLWQVCPVPQSESTVQANRSD